jgi:hypothetical protein
MGEELTFLPSARGDHYSTRRSKTDMATARPNCDSGKRMLLKLGHLYSVLIAVSLWFPASSLAQRNPHKSNVKASFVSVPFVGCESDGQVGPEPAPEGPDKPVWLNAVANPERLAYYQSESSAGVLAPRGWHGFGTYGSMGSTIIVTPDPIKSYDDLGAITGPFIKVVRRSGETSGRFEVAQVAARVFPTLREYAKGVIKENLYPEGDFPFGPYPRDKLTYLSDLVVEYETPPHCDGLGTEYGYASNGEPISGVAMILGGDSPYLEILTVRLMPDKNYLAPQIIKQFKRDESEP